MSPSWTIYRGVNYGPSSEQTADLYLLNHGIHPAVVFIHGGGWSTGDKSAYESRAKKYALAGFHVISINYRLAKFDDLSSQWPAQFDDVRSAIRWVRQNAPAWRIDPSRIGVGGDSAGAHLALMLGTTQDRPNAILDMFGPCDLSLSPLAEFVCALPIFNRQTCQQAPALYASACPLNLMTAIFPPTMIMHGVGDETVAYSQSVRLDQRMRELNIDHRLVSFNGGHEFTKLSAMEQTLLELQGLWWFVSKLQP